MFESLTLSSLGIPLHYLSCGLGMPYAEASSLKLVQSVAASGGLAESYSSKFGQLFFCYFLLEAHLASQCCAQAVQAVSSCFVVAYCFVASCKLLRWPC